MKRRGCRLTLISVLTALVLLAGAALWGGLAARRWAGRAKQDLYALRGLLADDPQWWPTIDQVREARMRLEEADIAIGAANRGLGWLFGAMSEARWWPWLSDMGACGDHGLDAAQRLTRVAWWSVLRVESAVEQYGTTNSAGGVPVLMDQRPVQAGLVEVYRQRDQLVAVRHDLVAIQRALPQSLAEHDLAVLLDPFAVDLVLLGLEAIGPDGERNYLVLIQNSDEMRATGGFISSVAVVRIADHNMVSFEYMNSYDVEAYHEVHPPAPKPQARIMDQAVLLFRDANWSPDWPTTAEVAGALYQMDMGEEVSGVVAIDTAFVRLMLEALGPIDLPAQGVTVTAENVIETIVGFWENPENSAGIGERDMKHGEWLAHRKDFGKPLIDAAIQRLSGVGSDDLPGLLVSCKEATRAKHLLVWSLDSQPMQQAAVRAGLDGALRTTSGDYLMVVDTNMGWNKVDRNIRRGYAYQVDPATGMATLTLRYQNESPVDAATCEHISGYKDTYELLAQDCYWNYARILVPRGSELIDVIGGDGVVDTMREGDRVVWGTFIVAPPSETTTLTWRYRLPESVTDGEVYRLYIQKQPGVQDVTLAVTLVGAGGAVVREPWRATTEGVVLNTTLEADLALAIAGID